MLLLPLFSGFVYALGSFLTKRALSEGAGILRFSFLSNWAMLFTFSIPLLWQERSADFSQLHWPVLAGAFFFFGQVTTFAAIRVGSVSIQTPLMGTKVLFVSIFSILLGTQVITSQLWLASGITAVAVALLGWGGLSGNQPMAKGMTLALGSAACFAMADVLLGRGAQAFGPAPFLTFMMATNALLSLGLIPFFREGLRAFPKGAWHWTLGGVLLMAIQSAVLGYFFANSGLIAEGNILYSSRGIWSVLLGIVLAGAFSLPGEHMTRKVLLQRLTGAALMSAAIWLVVAGSV